MGGLVSFERFATADFQGYVTGPITPTMNIRVAARSVQGGGWQKSHTRDDTIGQRDFTQGRILLDWKPTDRLSLSDNLNGFVDHGETQADRKSTRLNSSH